MKTEKDVFKKSVKELGYTLNDDNLNVAFIAFKGLQKKLKGANP